MDKKSEQLGMPFGTASNRLRKELLFSLLQKYDICNCYRCGSLINSSNELSIDHKIPWLDNSPELFWDLNNIAYSHLKCNSKLARKYNKIYSSKKDRKRAQNKRYYAKKKSN